MARNKKSKNARGNKSAKRKGTDTVTEPLDDGDDFSLESQEAPAGEPGGPRRYFAPTRAM